jgi:hypothetical protein
MEEKLLKKCSVQKVFKDLDKLDMSHFKAKYFHIKESKMRKYEVFNAIVYGPSE